MIPQVHDSRRRRRHWRRHWRGDERGSAAIEAAIGTPAFGLLVAMIILGGRVEMAKQSVQAAAYEAARAASIERTQGEAIAAGKTAATTSLHNENVHCTSTDITVNAAAFNASLGTTAQITVAVTCRVDLSDLALPVPGHRVITATASSPIDAFRERR